MSISYEAVRDFLNREGLCDHDPANGLAPPKGERRYWRN